MIPIPFQMYLDISYFLYTSELNGRLVLTKFLHWESDVASDGGIKYFLKCVVCKSKDQLFPAIQSRKRLLWYVRSNEMSVEARALRLKDTNQWVMGNSGPRRWKLNRKVMLKLQIVEKGMSRQLKPILQLFKRHKNIINNIPQFSDLLAQPPLSILEGMTFRQPKVRPYMHICHDVSEIGKGFGLFPQLASQFVYRKNIPST